MRQIFISLITGTITGKELDRKARNGSLISEISSCNL